MIKENLSVKYLAAPYSHEKPDVMESRFKTINLVAAQLLKDGHFIYSSISHCHQMAKDHRLPTNFEFWRDYDKAMLSKCDQLFVLCLDGWKNSVGVQAEIEIAKELGLTIKYIDFQPR